MAEPLLCTKIPVEKGDQYDGKHDAYDDGMIELAGGDDQIILVNTQCLICVAVHDIQIDGIKRNLCQDTGKDRRDTELCM